MVYKQINLSLTENLRDKAQTYANMYGYKNIQELAAEALREKIFAEDLTPAEWKAVHKAEKEKSMGEEEFMEKVKDLL